MRTHQLNVTHLTIGLILLGISGLWAAHAAGWVGDVDGSHVVPFLFIGAGLVGLVAFASRGARRPTAGDAPSTYDTYDSEEHLS